MQNKSVNLRVLIAILVVLACLSLSLSLGRAGVGGVYFGGIPDDTKSQSSGVYLQHVIPGSPAEKAGLQVGDLIVQVGVQRGVVAIRKPEDLLGALQTQPPGVPVKVTYIRHGFEYKTDVTLEPRW
jgi:S1-C subfamily serine protease